VLRDGIYNLFARATAGGEQEERITRSERTQGVLDWSPDGQFLLYGQDSPTVGTDLWIQPMNGANTPVTYVKTRLIALYASFSPDGRWIAYNSDESGRQEIYVRSFPGGETRRIASQKGGNYPKWAPDGVALFYISLEGELMSVPVRKTSNSLEFGSPQMLFRMRVARPSRFSYPYDVLPDGRRFLVLLPTQDEAPSLTVVLGWKPARRK